MHKFETNDTPQDKHADTGKHDYLKTNTKQGYI